MKSKPKPKLDSYGEDRIEPRMIALGFIRCNAFFMQDGIKRQFSDKLKSPFHAKRDWWHPRLKVSGESKFHTLNAKTSQASADAAMTRQLEYRQGRGEASNKDLARYDQLNNQWTHSQVKQAIVQQALTPYEQIVFFKKPPTLEEMQTYTSKGLFPIALDSMQSYLLNLRLHQTGATGYGYSATYTADTGERVVFSLGKYIANDLQDTYVCQFVPGEKVLWLVSRAV